MRDRRAIIEFALLIIILTVLGGIARNVLPDVHQLLRFALVVVVTVLLWLAARVVLRRYEQP
jgi:Na+/proline symporter